MSNDLTVINNTLTEVETNFNGIAKEHGAVKWETEFNFSMQALQANDFLRKIAIQDKQSLKNAIVNLASVGLSLNPANKHAYLVPRDGKVCLDISYMGLVHLACESGALKWVQADIVKANDSFKFSGVGVKPLHEYDPFSDRGSFSGVYCVAKTEDGEYLTTVMNIEEVYAIRDRSSAFKRSGKGPWATDFEEMAKKTVIKRASKLWPKNDKRVSSAINVANQVEGIDFEAEKAVEMITSGQAATLKDLLGELKKSEKEFLPYLSSVEKREIPSIDSLTKNGAENAIGLLKGIISRTTNNGVNNATGN